MVRDSLLVNNMKYQLIGYPLNYSFSPFIHKSFNSDIDYSIKVLEEKDLDEFFQKKEFSGLNVTIPYKEKVIKQIAEEYKNVIPQKVYEAMYKYEVEITD